MKRLLLLPLFLTSCSFGLKISQNKLGKLEYSSDTTIAPLVSYSRIEHKEKDKTVIDRKIRFFAIAPIPEDQKTDIEEKSSEN